MGSFTLQVTNYEPYLGSAATSSKGANLAARHGLTPFFYGAVEAEEQNDGRKLFSTTIKASDTKPTPKDEQEVKEILTAFEKALQKEGVHYSIDRNSGNTPIVNVVLGKATQDTHETTQGHPIGLGFSLGLSIPNFSAGSYGTHFRR